MCINKEVGLRRLFAFDLLQQILEDLSYLVFREAHENISGSETQPVLSSKDSVL